MAIIYALFFTTIMTLVIIGLAGTSTMVARWISQAALGLTLGGIFAMTIWMVAG